MKRLALMLGLAGVPLLAACGSTEVVVQVAVEPSEGAEARPLGDLPVRALPYDRDLIFDSLTSAAATPQPEIPDSLQALQDQIAAAQLEWQTAETQWGSARDSLKTLSDQLRGMSRASPQYVVAFRDFGAQETLEQQSKRRSDAAFARFTQLQERFNAQAEAIRSARNVWGDETFAPVDSIIDARLEALGLEEHADTTSANGVARFEGLKPGTWWIHARYELPYSELYWNQLVEVTRGEPVQVVLNRANAQVRPKL